MWATTGTPDADAPGVADSPDAAEFVGNPAVVIELASTMGFLVECDVTPMMIPTTTTRANNAPPIRAGRTRRLGPGKGPGKSRTVASGEAVDVSAPGAVGNFGGGGAAGLAGRI
jgi:hypothetical protein